MKESTSNPQTLIGTVVSDKAEKTAVVLVERRVRHPKYGKYLTRSVKMHAHDPEHKAKVGNSVKIVSCSPVSKNKSWLLKEVIS